LLKEDACSTAVFGAFIFFLGDETVKDDGHPINYTSEAFIASNLILVVVTIKIALTIQ
jgi:hypothetical protein